MQKRGQYARHISDLRAEEVFGKKTKSLSYIQQGILVTYFEINEKSSSTVVVMMPWSEVVIVKNFS